MQAIFAMFHSSISEQNCVIFLVSCVLVHRSLCSILHGIKASAGQCTSPTPDSYLDPFFWETFLLPVLHQKRRIYHLISQVKELLINLDWSTMLGVKEIPKVQTINLTLYVWLGSLQCWFVHWKRMESTSRIEIEKFNS